MYGRLGVLACYNDSEYPIHLSTLDMKAFNVDCSSCCRESICPILISTLCMMLSTTRNLSSKPSTFSPS
ncbi:hypothetical protein Mapa_013015 [Marchantia paleacea]|nr:hypothetical protein Mapa_013015 [Marchantia paleacea]